MKKVLKYVNCDGNMEMCVFEDAIAYEVSCVAYHYFLEFYRPTNWHDCLMSVELDMDLEDIHDYLLLYDLPDDKKEAFDFSIMDALETAVENMMEKFLLSDGASLLINDQHEEMSNAISRLGQEKVQEILKPTDEPSAEELKL